MNRRALTIALLAASTGLLACEEDTEQGPGFLCDITNPVRDAFLPATRSVPVHSPPLLADTVQLKVLATNRFGELRTDRIVWEFRSSDPTVATVNSAGVVSALRPGTTRITAEACGKEVSTQVTVFPAF